MTPRLGEKAHPQARPSVTKTAGHARQSLAQERVVTPERVRSGLARRLHAIVGGFEWSTTTASGGCAMSWTKPEFEVVELGMEVGAYAGTA